MLEVEGLGHVYRTASGEVEAVRQVDLTVAEGEIVTLVGPSGAGKTTLLRSLAGLLPYSRGEVRLGGDVVRSPHPDMALVFQDYTRSLMPWATVRQNVLLPIRKKVRSRAERDARVDAALAEVGLADAADRYPWQLSGGMQQRVALARGLAYRPKMLLFDEPFASVDAQTRADLEDLVLDVCAHLRMTALFVTHDIDEAAYLADRIVVVSHRPSTVRAVLDVDLPRPRDQVTTKSLPAFAELRSRIFPLLRAESAEATA
ncbi:ABC transporter ATP-binding protein [Actinomadura syzygii]|uniref:ABC transporter ATP-binding protein n=1 Tax=Actinomadura syzygii TaxID=1427538 RepID=A0A5D0TUB1_9ACTN|nr:ABC transporter ATP-binding protein [Actinomadura syzygii]TYC08915.1 ABC transporter ATP-binding protein [Actinomadura syzygii]